MQADGERIVDATSKASSPAGGVGLGRPTRARQLVIVFAVTLAIITYIDRVCISQAEPFIRQDLGLTKVQMGYIFSAFLLAYSLFEIPGGWLGDYDRPAQGADAGRDDVVPVYGGDRDGLEHDLDDRVPVLLRPGEAGCFPNLTKAFTVWLPQPERVRAEGVSGSRTVGWSVHAAVGDPGVGTDALASGLRPVWQYRRGVGGVFLSLVPR